jgi:hypothetical protein
LVTFSRIFFRSPSLSDAFGYIETILFDFRYENYIHPMGYRMIDFYILLFVLLSTSIEYGKTREIRFLLLLNMFVF